MVQRRNVVTDRPKSGQGEIPFVITKGDTEKCERVREPSVGPDREEQLKALNPNERMAQEAEELLVATQRLIDELQQLVDRAKELSEQRVENVEAAKRRK
jgi:hypothetical protein